MPANFVKVAKTTELPEGEMKLIEIDDERILLVNVDGSYYAIDDTCTHAECPLSEGYLENEIVECSCHGAQFNVKTGEVARPPAFENLIAYPVKVEEEDILIGPG